jgi:hypothetical protein
MAPTLSISPTTYKRGDTLTLTVTDAPRPSTPAEHDLITVTNPATGQISTPTPIDLPAVPPQPFAVKDTSPRVWTQTSDDGTKATFTGIA